MVTDQIDMDTRKKKTNSQCERFVELWLAISFLTLGWRTHLSFSLLLLGVHIRQATFCWTK